MGSSLLRFLGLLFLVLTVQEYLSVEVLSFFQSPAFCPSQGWIPCPAVFSRVMWCAVDWLGCLSVQEHSLPDSRRPFHLSCYRSMPMYSSFSKFLTMNCWVSVRAYFRIEVRAPEWAVPPPSAEGNTSLWETSEKIKMLETVAWKAFIISPMTQLALQANSAGPSAAPAPLEWRAHTTWAEDMLPPAFAKTLLPAELKVFIFFYFSFIGIWLLS